MIVSTDSSNRSRRLERGGSVKSGRKGVGWAKDSSKKGGNFGKEWKSKSSFVNRWKEHLKAHCEGSGA